MLIICLACQYSSGLNDSWVLVKRQERNVLHFTDFIPHLVIVSAWVPYIGITRAPFPSFFHLKLFSSMTSSFDAKLFDSFKLLLEYYLFLPPFYIVKEFGMASNLLSSGIKNLSTVVNIF